MLFGKFFEGAIFVSERNDVLGEMAHEFHGPVAFALHGFTALPFWLALGGFATATVFWLLKPSLADVAARVFAPIRKVLERKYGFDELYQALFARGSVLLGRGLWRAGDVAVIDNGVVNGSATLVDRLSGIVRRVQTGFLYHYAFLMIVGLIALLGVFVLTR